MQLGVSKGWRMRRVLDLLLSGAMNASLGVAQYRPALPHVGGAEAESGLHGLHIVSLHTSAMRHSAVLCSEPDGLDSLHPVSHEVA